MDVAPLIVILLILAPLAGGLVYLWVRVMKRPKPGMAHCGACSGNVFGVDSLTCPACNADLRIVGILKPKPTGGVTPAMFIPIWTLVYGILAMVAASIVISIGPMVHDGSNSQGLNPTNDKQTYSVTVSWKWRSTGDQYGGVFNLSLTGFLNKWVRRVSVLTT